MYNELKERSRKKYVFKKKRKKKQIALTAVQIYLFWFKSWEVWYNL